MAQMASNEKRPKYYRSIQYRSASFDIRPNKLNLNTQRLPSFQIKKSQTPYNQSRKSNKSLFRSQQNLKNFNKSISQSLSKAKQVQLNSTIISNTNPQQQNIHDFSTCNYLQSFEQLMESQNKQSCKKKKLDALTIKLQSLKNAHKIDKIALPNIIEYDNTQFTALDPIRLPLNSLKQDIQKTRKSISQCPNDLKLINCQIRQYKNRKIKQLDSFSNQFMQKIKKLWGCLRQNTVYQQGFTMRIKRQISQLQAFIPQFTKNLQTTHQNQLQIQTTIFQTAPFQLSINKQFIQQKQQTKTTLTQTIPNYF